MGLATVISPLFTIHPVDWKPPEPSRFDALMLTSANAAACAGPPIQRYDCLPCYCVGDATASAARAAGLDRVRSGDGDAEALLAQIAADRVGSLLWLCGRDRMELSHPAMRIEPRIVYASDPVTELAPEALRALAAGAVPLVHSPRAARLFAALMNAAGVNRALIQLAAISTAAANALGSGWGDVAAASAPRDQPLLELAAKLCKTGAMGNLDQSA